MELRQFYGQKYLSDAPSVSQLEDVFFEILNNEDDLSSLPDQGQIIGMAFGFLRFRNGQLSLPPLLREIRALKDPVCTKGKDLRYLLHWLCAHRSWPWDVARRLRREGESDPVDEGKFLASQLMRQGIPETEHQNFRDAYRFYDKCYGEGGCFEGLFPISGKRRWRLAETLGPPTKLVLLAILHYAAIVGHPMTAERLYQGECSPGITLGLTLGLLKNLVNHIVEATSLDLGDGIGLPSALAYPVADPEYTGDKILVSLAVSALLFAALILLPELLPAELATEAYLLTRFPMPYRLAQGISRLRAAGWRVPTAPYPFRPFVRMGGARQVLLHGDIYGPELFIDVPSGRVIWPPPPGLLRQVAPQGWRSINPLFPLRPAALSLIDYGSAKGVNAVLRREVHRSLGDPELMEPVPAKGGQVRLTDRYKSLIANPVTLIRVLERGVYNHLLPVDAYLGEDSEWTYLQG